MDRKNLGFLKRLSDCLADKGIDYSPKKRGDLRKFAHDAEINYTTLHKCFREPGYVLPIKDLIKLKKFFNRSIDWFLTGEDADGSPCPHSADCPFKDCDEETLEFCKTVKDILKSTDKLTALALKNNIQAFDASVKKDGRIDNLERRVEELEAKNASKQSTDTG